MTATIEGRKRRGRSPARTRGWCVAAAVLLAMSGPAAAWMDDAPLPVSGLYTQLGVAERGTRAFSVGLTREGDWRLPLGRGQLGGYTEFHVGRWRAPEGPQPSHWTTQVGVTPILRWHPVAGAAWFVEGGIGVNTIAPAYRNGRRRFGTEFNFGDHVGMGMRIDRQGRQELIMRLEHYSNGGIESPNPGEEFLQVRFQRRF